MLVLDELGYRIATVTTARQLLERVGSCPWSLILLSATLTRRTGAELLYAIRADPAEPRFADRDDRRRNRRALERGLARSRRHRSSQSADRSREPVTRGRARGPGRPSAFRPAWTASR